MSQRTLSSTAQRAYWLGRYLERASNTARLVMVNANLLMDLPVRVPHGWLPLIEILAVEDEFQAAYGEVSDDPAQSERSVARFLLREARNPGSILNSLNFARENARALRGTLPKAAFEYINDAHLFAKEALAEPLSRTRRNNGLTYIVQRMQQIDGFLSSTMLHDTAWQFIRLGNFIERADMTTRIIDLPTLDSSGPEAGLEAYADNQWRSVLDSLDAVQAFTVTMQSPINQEDVLEFLFKSPEMPRSLLRTVTSARNCLRAIPRNTVPLAQANQMRRQLQRARVRTLSGPRLHKYVDSRQKQISSLHQKIAETYFN